MTGLRGCFRSSGGTRMTQTSLDLPHKLVVPGVVHGRTLMPKVSFLVPQRTHTVGHRTAAGTWLLKVG
jgi:hypothetical protein